MARDSHRLVQIDRLRLLAALAVVAQHYLESSFPNEAAPILQLGPGVFGVALFFMISGYVMPLSVRDSVRTWRDTADFIQRRILRIFPLYLVTLAVLLTLAALQVPPFTSLRTLTSWQILANATLVFEYTGAPAMLGVAWSLSLEFAWYAIFWIYFLLWGHRRNHGQIAWAVTLASLFLILMTLVSWITEYRLPLGRMSMIMAAFYGCALCAARQGDLSPRAVFGTALCCISSVGFGLWIGFDHFQHPTVSFQAAATPWAISFILFTIFCTAKLNNKNATTSCFALEKLGLFSFGIYLLHDPIYHLLSLLVGSALLPLVALIATLVSARYAYHYVERPAQLRSRLASPSTPIQSPPNGASQARPTPHGKKVKI